MALPASMSSANFVVDGRPRFGEIPRADDQVAAARCLRCPHPIDGPPVRDGQQPAARAAPIRVERSGGLPGFEKHLLQHLLALRPIDHDSHDETKDSGRHHVVELGEGALITLGCSQQRIVRGISGFAAPENLDSINDHLL